MSATIFLEGGGDSKDSESRCREGFRKLLEKCGFHGKMPVTVACGGRSTVFEDFCTSHSTNTEGRYIAMWIDSEEPMEDIEKTWRHLAKVSTVPKWKKPAGAEDDQVLFMTTCMETYILPTALY